MMENPSKNKPSVVEPTITDGDRRKSLDNLYLKLRDFAYLDVITIKGNFEVIRIDTDKDKNIIDIAASLPNTIKVLAQTHIQLDGDTLNAIPTDNVGNVTNKEILDFHLQTVQTSLQNRKERFEMLVELIRDLHNR